MNLWRTFALLGLVAACLGTGASAIAAPTDDLVLKGDAKCTGCHDETDDAKPTMLVYRNKEKQQA